MASWMLAASASKSVGQRQSYGAILIIATFATDDDLMTPHTSKLTGPPPPMHASKKARPMGPIERKVRRLPRQLQRFPLEPDAAVWSLPSDALVQCHLLSEVSEI